MKKFLSIILGIFALIFYVSCISVYITYSNQSFTTSNTEYFFKTSDFTWPLPGYNKISSNFGFRISPINRCT